MTDNKVNSYAEFLKEQGCYTVSVGGIDWYDYRGFMVPAYLPHRIPLIGEKTAYEVLKKSRRLFVRWDSEFGGIYKSEWWYILRRGPWSIDSVDNKKKRWMIRQGKKKF